MIIYDKTNKQILDIAVDDTSYRYRAIRQGDRVYLYFSLTAHVEIPLHSYIDFQGQRYTLWKPENVNKHGERNLEYDVQFGGQWELLNRTKYKLTSGKPHKLKFPLTAKPRMFMQLLIDNLNLHDSGWTLGTCIEASEKALAFNHENCMDVINRLADEYNTEFEFVGKTINFGKVERSKDDPLPLSYGKGNGFKTGIGRQSQGDKAPVTILYVQGGERNIDLSTYKSPTLLLPKSQELEYQQHCYKTDADGMYVTRADRPLVDRNEDSYDASDIYPSRVGTVSAVITVDAAKNLYDIKDASIPAALNYSQCRIAGEKATIIFQTGILAGKEFDLEQTDKELTGYIHAERRFKIVPQETDGQVMPNATFKPAVGDQYAIFHISLPTAYVCDNATKTGASWDMFREAVRYMAENEEECFTFTGELDGIWAKKKWLEIGGKLQPGSYIQFSDTQFQPTGIAIRITGIKDYINKPHSPELELSNTPVAGFLSSDLGKLEGNEVKDEERHKDGLSFTMRRWMDAINQQKMMEKAFADYGKGQSMSWLRTMSILVGHESLQFRFVNRIATTANPTVSEVDHRFDYDNTTKVFTTPAGIIQHMTLGIDSLSPSHKGTEYKYWNISAFTSASIDIIDPLYLYIKCSKSGTSGSFLFSKEPKDMDGADGYYYFLCGALSDEVAGIRSFATVYGFSEIGPGWMRLNKIISPDGTQYWDMLSRAFRIGNDNSNLSFSEDAGVILKGIFVQSPSGKTSPLPVYIGQYKSNTVYYPGDEVLYNGSTYRCVKQISNVYPTNTTYWTVIALKGTDGRNGYDGTDGRDGIDGKDGINGTNGIPGALPTQRKWTSGTTYYRNNDTVDYVMYQSSKGAIPTWWRVKKGLTSVAAGGSPDANYFEQISSFEAIATMVLLANEANLANFIFKDGMLVSQEETNGVRNLILNGKTGEARIMKGVFAGYLQLPFVPIEDSDADYYSGSYTLKNNLNVITLSNEITLPTATKYQGAIVSIYNNAWPPYTKTFTGTYIKTQNGQKIYVPKSYDMLPQDDDFKHNICVSSGVVRLVALMGRPYSGGVECIRWCVLN